MKKKLASIFLLMCLAVNTAFGDMAPSQPQPLMVPTTNAYYDSQQALAHDRDVLEVVNNNIQNDSGQTSFNVTDMALSGAGAGLTGYGAVRLGKSMFGAATDTMSRPWDWAAIVKGLKPWERAAIGIFVAVETSELVFGGMDSSNAVLKDPQFKATPIGDMKKSADVRVNIFTDMFKVIGAVTMKVGTMVSNILILLTIFLGAFETLFITLKTLTSPQQNSEFNFTNIFKEQLPHFAFLGIICALLFNGLLWKIYVGPVFNFCTAFANAITNQKFSMYNLPDYLGKIFNMPFVVMWQGFKLLMSGKMLINSYLPFLVIVSSLALFFLSIKCVCEIMTILIDYLLIGVFSLFVIVFTALGITRQLGKGIINGILRAMLNVMLMFTVSGLLFGMIDQISRGPASTSPSKLLATISGIYIANILLMSIKTMGSMIGQGSNAYIQGNTVISELTTVAMSYFGISSFIGAIQTLGTKKLMEQFEKDNPEKFKQLNSDKERMKYIKKHSSAMTRFRTGIANMTKSSENFATVVNSYNQKNALQQAIIASISQGLTGNLNEGAIKSAASSFLGSKIAQGKQNERNGYGEKGSLENGDRPQNSEI